MLSIDLQTKGRLTRQKWSEIAAAADPRCDPYLIWFDFSCEEAGSEARRSAAAVSVDVLLELPDSVGADPQKADELIALLGRRPYFFETRTPVVPHSVVQKFVCGTLPISGAFALSQAIAGLADRNMGVRFELASARFLSLEELKTWNMPVVMSGYHSDGRKAFDKLRAAAVPAARAAGQQLAPAAAASSAFAAGQATTAEPQPLVVVIDDFCNFASWSLREKNRIVSIWRQGGARVKSNRQNTQVQGPESSDPEPDETYGVVDRIRTVASTGSKVAADEDITEERHAYFRYIGRDGRVRNKLPRHWSHGSAVLSMLTTNATAPSITDPDGLHALCRPDDIEFVQLPDVAVLDTSGGSLGAFAIDALQRAVKLAFTDTMRKDVIVNLSFGTHSGPHDGTSMFERAVLDLLRQYNGRTVKDQGGSPLRLPTLHVVLPAGNTHIERTHASAWLPSSGDTRELKWMIPPDTDTDSFMEVWIGDADDGGGNRQTVEIQLELPDGDVLEAPVKAGDVAPLTAKVGTVEVLRGAVIYPKTTSRGLKGTLALIAVAPTRRRADFGKSERYLTNTDGPPAFNDKGEVEGAMPRAAMEAPPGCWTVRLKNTGTQPVQFHAWIQRHDSAPGRRRAGHGYQGRQSYFVEADGLPTDPCFTLNGIATASCPGQLWVVGAMDERGGIPLYTAAGPDRLAGTRVEGPDVAVTVDRSRNAPGRHVGGVFSGSRLRVGGSSIGAAVFTRMLFHTLYKGGLPMWCDAGAPVPPPVRTAETPAMAADWLRGALSRLRHADQLVIAAARGKVDDKPKR